MEKIKLTDNSEYDLITNGIFPADESLTVTFYKGSNDLTSLYEIFSNPVKTKQITLLSGADEPLAVYGNYTSLASIAVNQEEDPTVTVILKKADEKEIRLESLEEQMTDAQEALCDIYELIIG